MIIMKGWKLSALFMTALITFHVAADEEPDIFELMGHATTMLDTYTTELTQQITGEIAHRAPVQKFARNYHSTPPPKSWGLLFSLDKIAKLRKDQYQQLCQAVAETSLQQEVLQNELEWAKLCLEKIEDWTTFLAEGKAEILSAKAKSQFIKNLQSLIECLSARIR
jgi:hypothetical protein